MLEILETFNTHPFIAKLPARDRLALAAGAQPFCFRDGEVLAVAGTRADTFYLVQSGEVAVCSVQEDHGELLVQKMGPGEVVGWSWINPPYVWEFTCQAVGEVRGAKFDAWWLRTLCERDHEIGYHILKYLAQVIARRLTGMRHAYVELLRSKCEPITMNSSHRPQSLVRH